jgi:hypothetical protein
METRARELEQVEKYMRICIAVHEGFKMAVTISPSELLLSEASRFLMAKYGSFDVPCFLLEQLEKPGLDEGDQGELVAELILFFFFFV